MIRKVLIHRYDNEADILAVEKHGCSEVYKRARNDDFKLVIILPTAKARTRTVAVGEAISRQYTPTKARDWPGRPDAYPIRVDVKNVRYTTLTKVREAMRKAHVSWEGAWSLKSVELEEEDLF